MVQFAVTLKNTQRTVFKDGVPINQGMSRSAAIAMADAMAFEAEEAGDDVDLVIQSYTGELNERHSGGGKPKYKKRS
jgi:galactokinase